MQHALPLGTRLASGSECQSQLPQHGCCRPTKLSLCHSTGMCPGACASSPVFHFTSNGSNERSRAAPAYFLAATYTCRQLRQRLLPAAASGACCSPLAARLQTFHVNAVLRAWRKQRLGQGVVRLWQQQWSVEIVHVHRVAKIVVLHGNRQANSANVADLAVSLTWQHHRLIDACRADRLMQHAVLGMRGVGIPAMHAGQTLCRLPFWKECTAQNMSLTMFRSC